MRKLVGRRTPLRIVIAAIATLAVLGGTAYATVLAPSGGQIRACAGNGNGSLRAVGAGDDCRKGERSLSWNVAGRAGTDGTDGSPGPAGPQGPAGAAGSQGPAGAAGSQGPAGAAGSQGPAGAAGSQGPAGAAGSQGPAGAAGSQGPAGAAGSQGPAGAAGSQGPAGPAGAQGPSGATGPQAPAAALGLAYASLTFANPAASQYTGANGVDTGDVPCATGKKVVGGGINMSSGNQAVRGSFPSDGMGAGAPGQAGWTATVQNNGRTDQAFTVFAICVTP
jgi:hypothetical protein